MQLTKAEKFLTYFLPHPHTHQKAKLLSWHYLVIYILLFIFLRVGLDLVSIYRPGVLGINSNITISEIIGDTNKERQKLGLSILRENRALDLAAQAKAKNMFEENYWAHFSPSGKDPWGFISGAGYKFSYAGENLAKNFYNSGDVVEAWMNSPTHKDNLLNSHYEDIGIAVVEGVLQGQKTTLVVQMFGRPVESAVASSPKVSVDLSGLQASNAVAGASSAKASVDPYLAMKAFAMFFLVLIGSLLAVDFIILKKRGVYRFSSHHLAHLSFLALAGSSVLNSKAGEILVGIAIH